MCVSRDTHNRAGVVILDVDLPQKSALVVLIHGGDRSGRRRSAVVLVPSRG